MNTLNDIIFLGFRLDPFHRLSWTSTTAKATWAPRLERIRRAGFETHTHMISCGETPGVMRDMAAWEWLRLQGALGEEVGLMPYARDAEPALGTGAHDYRPLRYSAILYNKQLEGPLQEAMGHHDPDALAILLGTPDCCRAAARERHHRYGFSHFFLAAALATPGPNSAERIQTLACPPVNNISLRALGLQALFHTPCQLHCAASLARGTAFLRGMEAAGFAEERAWLEAILAWPVDWSCLHGIAEIKTPVFKLVVDTEATAHRHTVQLRGDAYPKEGSTGLGYPYRQPHFSKIRDSKGYQQGLNHTAALSEAPPQNPPRGDGMT